MRAKRVDNNQSLIVAGLRARHISVETNKDDILVGYRGNTYWFELKSQKNKSGTIPESKIRDSQKKLRSGWRGQYDIVTTIDEILTIIGFYECESDAFIKRNVSTAELV